MKRIPEKKVPGKNSADRSRGVRSAVNRGRTSETRIMGVNQILQQLIGTRAPDGRFKVITDGVVDIFAADIARIWRIGRGDGCSCGCVYTDGNAGGIACTQHDRCLHLVASSARSIHIDGSPHQRLPFGHGEVGVISVCGEHKYISHDVTRDPLICDSHWAKKCGLKSFAGYRLISAAGEAIGVLSIFSKRRISAEEDALLESLANTAAQVIQMNSAEEELKRSEEKFYKAFNSNASLMAISTVDDGRYIDVNDKFLNVLGYNREEVLGKTSSDLNIFVDYARRHAAIDQLRKNGCVRDFEVEVRAKSGRMRHGLFSADFIELDGIKYLLTVMNDITERKNAEIKLTQSEEKNRIFFESAPDPCYLSDLSGRFIDGNKAAEDLIGYTKNELVGKSFLKLKLLTPRELKKAAALLSRSVMGKPTGPDELNLIRKDGTQVCVEIRTHPIKTGGRKVVLGIARDISDRKRVQEQMKISLREKEVLLKEVHHRVKNNMQVISSMLNLQSKYVRDKEALRMIIESQNRVRSMALIHEKLYQSKDLARINFGEYVLHLTKYLYGSHGIIFNDVKLEVRIPNTLLGIDEAIPCGLIINELVSNALQHAFPGGRKGEIKISMASRNGTHNLSVSDNGIGFPGNIDFRNTESLGLQIVNSLITQLGGDIQLNSNGHGSEFVIRFPRNKKEN